MASDGACTALQEDELLSLASIWPDHLESRRTDDGLLELLLDVDVHLAGHGDRAVVLHSSGSSAVPVHHLRYLPPIQLRVLLPRDYPERVPPEVAVSTSWLATASSDWETSLAADLTALWEHDPCIFSMIDHLQHLYSSGNHTLHVYESPSTPPSSMDFVARIASYDKLRRTAAFEEGAFTCQICLEGRKGRQSIVLEGCHHIFCISCMRSMMELAIREGDPQAIACPDPACSQPDTQSVVTIQPHEIERVVGAALFAKYLRHVEQRQFDNDPTTSYCPRCQTPAIAPEEDDYATLRQCSKCTYTWCSLCSRSYHGIASCPSSELTDILNEYLSADVSKQALMITRHGKQLIKLALKHQDELAYAAWVADNSMACPNCRVQVERSDGCAKMICTRCSTYFCYNCGIKLSRIDPYQHYNESSSPCFRKLFAHMSGTEEEAAPWAWAAAGAML